MRWTAIYKDDTELHQFIEDGTEILFKEIEQDKLKAFRLDDGDRHIIVDLNIGLFMVNGTVFEFPELSYKKGYRLIYFRRNAVDIGTSGNIDKRSMEHFVGFQITIDGKNRQAMISEKLGVFKIHTK